MKAILVAFLLFASIIFIPTSTLARVMKEEKDQGLIPTTNNPNKPVCKEGPKGGYRGCIPLKPVPTPTPPICVDPYSRTCDIPQKPAPPPPCSNPYKRNC